MILLVVEEEGFARDDQDAMAARVDLQRARPRCVMMRVFSFSGTDHAQGLLDQYLSFDPQS